MQRMCRRGFKAELRVPRSHIAVDRVNEQRTDPNQLAGLYDARHCVQQQRAPEMLALMAGINGQASEQDDGYRLVAGQATQDSRCGFARHHRPGRKRVVAGDIRICLSGDEHA